MKKSTITIISALVVLATGIGVVHVQENAESRSRSEAFKKCLTEADGIDYVDACRQYADWISKY